MDSSPPIVNVPIFNPLCVSSHIAGYVTSNNIMQVELEGLSNANIDDYLTKEALLDNMKKWLISWKPY
jgi:hypothetical protein